MPYKVINQTNSVNRKSRLNKDLVRYKNYLDTVSSRANKLIENLHKKAKVTQMKGDITHV